MKMPKRSTLRMILVEAVICMIMLTSLYRTPKNLPDPLAWIPYIIYAIIVIALIGMTSRHYVAYLRCR